MDRVKYRYVIDGVYERACETLATEHAVGFIRSEDLTCSSCAAALAEGLRVFVAVARE